MNEQHANVVREVRAKLRTVADMYELAPEDVVRIWLNNGSFGSETADAKTRRKAAKAAKPASAAHAEGDRA